MPGEERIEPLTDIVELDRWRLFVCDDTYDKGHYHTHVKVNA
jgi:hypothetical protein